MKKSINIFFCLLLLVLFAGCSDLNSKLEMCDIKINCVGNGTATVESEKVPLGTIIKVTTIPDEGYKASRVWGGSYSKTTQDKNNKNIYYVFAATKEITIDVSFSKKYTRTIYKELKGRGKITTNPDSAYEGQKVELTVAPEYGYHLIKDSLKIASSDGTLEISQDEADPSKYYFVMPDGSVTIKADFELYFSFTTSQDKIKEGDVVSFSVNNYSDFSPCDLYISYSTDAQKELLESNVDFSGGMYKFTAKEGGTVTLYAKNPTAKDSSKEGLFHELTSFIVEIPTLPAGWENISCHILNDNSDDYDEGNEKYKSVTLISKSNKGSYPNYEYYYASNPDKKIMNCKYLGSGKCEINIEYSYEKNDSVFFRFYDESYKAISRTIQIDIPTYPEEPKTLGKIRLNAYNKLYISTSVFKNENTTIEVEEGGTEYFSVSKDGEYLVITSKKTTGKEWEVNVKNSSGKSLSKIMVKIPYSGTPDVKIEN